MEYLGFRVTRNGIRPVNKKVEAIVNMTPPNNIRQVRAFVGLLKYYEDMWDRRSHLLQPLNTLTSNTVMFKWIDVEQQEFGKIKQIVACDTLLIYPDFNESFDIHTYASYFQLGEVIRQNGKPTAFYRLKLMPAQLHYKVTEK